MATNDQRQTDKHPRDDKKTDKVTDLPAPEASGQDEQVKGGRMPLKPKL